MKNPDIRLYINDMKENADKILKKTHGMTLQDIKNDEFLQLGIERAFTILGEAANRIPKEHQQEFPTIPWAEIIGLRNIIIHTYDKVDTGELYKIIQQDLPVLKAELDKIWLEIK